MDAGDHFQHAVIVGVGGVDDEGVHAGVDKRGGALVGLFAGTDAGRNQQSPGRVLGRVRVLLGLDKVLDGNQTGELIVRIDDGQLFHLIGREQFEGFLLGYALARNDERHGRHDLADLAVKVRLEAHIAVGANAHQGAILVYHRQARDAEAGAQRVYFPDGHIRAGSDGVGDHAGLGALHNLYLLGLVLGGQVAVQHADTTLASHGNGHAGLGHGIHGGRGKRDAEADIAGKLRAGIDLGRHDIGFGGQQEHIVKGQAAQGYLVRVISTSMNTVLAHRGLSLTGLAANPTVVRCRPTTPFGQGVNCLGRVSSIGSQA